MRSDFLRVIKQYSDYIQYKLYLGCSWEDIQQAFKSKCINDCIWNAAFDYYIDDINIYYDIVKDINITLKLL